MDPIAHSAPDGSSANQTLDQHLQNVAKLAANFAGTGLPAAVHRSPAANCQSLRLFPCPQTVPAA